MRPNPIGSPEIERVRNYIAVEAEALDLEVDLQAVAAHDSTATGLPGLHFAYLQGSPIHHTIEDDIDSVGLGSLQHHGENVPAIARHFGNLDLSAIPSSDRSVFFTVGPFFVLYSARWAAVLAVFVVGLYGLPFVRSRRRWRVDGRTW